MEGAEEFPSAPGVFLHELVWFEAGVGDVASPAARDADLGEQVGGGLEEGDLAGLTEGFRARDRREEAGGSSAEDGDVAGGPD